MHRPEIEITGVLSMRENKFNSDFVDICEIAEKSSVSFHYFEDIDELSLAKILRESEAEIVFAIGWSRLIGTEIISIPQHGFIGFHPAALPRNRGRHPLIWALALGLEKTASTLFFIDQGTDSGEIISQEEIHISSKDDAQSLYDKVLAVLPRQINGVIDDLVAGELCGVTQNHDLANHWRKRFAPDGRIDWRMSASSIYNLTRALTHPYIGAEFYHNDQVVKVWRCEIVTEDVPHNAEPGKVLDVDDRGLVIKTGLGADGGAVRLLDTEYSPEFKKGDYL